MAYGWRPYCESRIARDQMMAGEPSGVRRNLAHYDPPQLIYQVIETMVDRVYLRHGVDVHEGDVVLDVGANVGVASVFFLECGAGLVHSFEPVPPLYELLVENLAPFPHARAHQLGLSSTRGRARITYYPGAAAMSGLYADRELDRELVQTCLDNRDAAIEAADRRTLEGFDEATVLDIEIDTLSSVLRSHEVDQVDLLKIDVEKAELDVINGIEQADWSRIRQAVVEVHDIDGRVRIVSQILRREGFSVTVDQDEPMRNTGIHLLYATR